MFGAGYVGAEDRLFFMDVLRNAGRGRLSSFAGGANRAMDREQWETAPYTEADLQRQADQFDDLYGAEGRRIAEDVRQLRGGREQVHRRGAALPALKMPGEYAAIGRPLGPEDWKITDIIATATLVGAIFGKGGGGELDSALVREEAQRRFGRTRGARVWSDFRSAEDPEAPTTAGRRVPVSDASQAGDQGQHRAPRPRLGPQASGRGRQLERAGPAGAGSSGCSASPRAAPTPCSCPGASRRPDIRCP